MVSSLVPCVSHTPRTSNLYRSQSQCVFVLALRLTVEKLHESHFVAIWTVEQHSIANTTSPDRIVASSLQVRKKETRRLRHLMVLMRIFALTLD